MHRLTEAPAARRRLKLTLATFTVAVTGVLLPGVASAGNSWSVPVKHQPHAQQGKY